MLIKTKILIKKGDFLALAHLDILLIQLINVKMSAIAGI